MVWSVLCTRRIVVDAKLCASMVVPARARGAVQGHARASPSVGKALNLRQSGRGRHRTEVMKDPRCRSGLTSTYKAQTQPWRMMQWRWRTAQMSCAPTMQSQLVNANVARTVAEASISTTAL